MIRFLFQSSNDINLCKYILLINQIKHKCHHDRLVFASYISHISASIHDEPLKAIHNVKKNAEYTSGRFGAVVLNSNISVKSREHALLA